MSIRRALLIGADQYGADFAQLPAVRTDVQIVSKALERCGYEIKIASSDVVRSPNQLGDLVQEYCDSCGPDDIHVLYFSGHGMILNNCDCVIPAGISLKDALRRSDKSINTDLTQLLGKSHGLIVFIIDACRSDEHARASKSPEGWGKHGESDFSGRFVRFFGCSSGQVCRVLEPDSGNREPVSVFSKCFSDVLMEGRASTLKELLHSVDDRCKDIADSAKLQLQTPRLSYGEDSVEMEATLNRRIFDVKPQHAVPTVWEAFDQNKLHCLVIASERETENPPASTLEDLVATVMLGNSAPDVWKGFADCWNGTRLVSDGTRSLTAQFEIASVRNATVSINTALQSPETLKTVVRALIESDIAVIDVTGFEPGVMMLLGIRSACRRGITICSHGNRWREGQPLALPFNLQDLSVASHTPREDLAGPDKVLARFLQRVLNGLSQLALQPRYLDLPAYDALRQLGPVEGASATIEVAKKVLVLCPYEPAFFRRWAFLSNSLEKWLSQSHQMRPEIFRIIDYANPQVVSQSIYEQTRRTAGCLADWSSFAPSVFFEMGVRLAVSDWGFVSVIDDTFVSESTDDHATERSNLRQVGQLRAFFSPLSYKFPERRGDFEQAAAALVAGHPQLRTDEGLSLVHETACRAIGVVQPAWPEVHEELSKTADALFLRRRNQNEHPQVLFYESDSVKQSSEKAALERRIAALLYMERRLGIERLAKDAELKRLFRQLAQTVQSALEDRGQRDDLKLSEYIGSRLDEIGKLTMGEE